MQWYIAAFVVHRDLGVVCGALCTARKYWCLLTAENSDRAHARAVELASTTVGELGTRERWGLDGIAQLLMLSEPPEDGGEIIWTETEPRPDELLDYVKRKEDLSVFRPPVQPPSTSEWYICEIVLVEVHDTGSHDDSVLVWTNSHLLRAADAESAYRSAFSLGSQHATQPESHRCDGDTAHWEFRGLGELLQTLAPPQDGAVLWYEQAERPLDEIGALVPPRRELGVFEWEERQGHRSGQ